MNFTTAIEFSGFRAFKTLLKKEILRFLSVGTQTLITPVISASLYLLVFGVSLGQRVSVMEEFKYVEFVIPGLIMMGVINNTFANVSSSLFMSRYLGGILDLIVTPITAPQFILAYTLASMLRGVLVGIVILLVSTFFAQLPWAYPLQAIGMILLASFLFSQLGLIASLYSNSFDHLGMYTNFLILPLIYLGGLFYPVSLLPEPWSQISMVNPLFYLIDGFRHATLGVGDTSFLTSFGVAGVIALILFGWASSLVANGKRMRPH